MVQATHRGVPNVPGLGRFANVFKIGQISIVDARKSYECAGHTGDFLADAARTNRVT